MTVSLATFNNVSAKLNNIDEMIKKLVKEKNKAFASLSKKDKRLAIAHDVIAMVKAGFVNVYEGCYGGIHTDTGIDSDKDLQSQIVNNDGSFKGDCNCCALGACFLAKTRLGNRTRSDGDIDPDDISSALGSIFGKRQMSLIEAAFELDNTSGEFNEKLSEKQAEKAIAFGEKHDSADKRLIAIMKNIIKNDGTFVP